MQALRIGLLGTVQAFDADRELAIGPHRHLAVLAMLALRANRVVSRDELVDEVWPAAPPASVVNGVHVIVGALRRILEPDRARRAPGQVLISVGSGYRLALAPGQLDVEVFDGRLRQARACLDTGAMADAVRAFDGALALWRGTPLTGVPGPYGAAERARLTEVWLAAVEARAQALIELGDLAVAAAELSALVAAHPMRERLRALLMVSLYRAGRQAEALEVFTRTRELLSAELAIEPGPELRRLQLDMLSGRDVTVADRRAPGPRGVVEPVVPRQLPPPVRRFAGRTGEMKVLSSLVEVACGEWPAVPIAVIDGTAGVGKTALGVYWAHQVADRFPDGQLYVDLRGFDPSGRPVEPAEAVRGFLEALGVPAERVPASLPARTGLYRTLLSARRVLVLLDNARDAEQVSPLLPGAPGCLAVVTTRSQLTRLVIAEGGQPLTLDLLSTEEARELLTRRLGERRVAGEPAAVHEMIDLCARLPLALSIVAARAATHQTFSLSTVASELRETHARLDALDGGEMAADVRGVFSWSYQNLSDPAARLFRLLGLHTGPDIGVPAASSLAALCEGPVRRALAELTRAHLVEERAPGRYACHDLLRAYAAELARRMEPAAQRTAALHRALDHYLHTAHHAAQLLSPYYDPIPLDSPQPGVAAQPLASFDQALVWFTTERASLLAAVRQAAEAGFDRHAWQLAWTLVEFLDRRGRWADVAAINHIALRAAHRLADHIGQAHTRRSLARGCARLGRYDEAHSHLRQALELYAESGDGSGQAHTHRSLAWLMERQGRYPEALQHAQQALELLRVAGHRAGQAQALNAVGWCHALLGDPRQALHYCRQALTLHVAIGDRHGAAGAWDSLGYANQHLGNHEQAVSCYRRAIDLCRDLGDRFNEAEILTRLGEVYAATDDQTEARLAWRRALAILDDLDHADAAKVRARL